MKKLKYLILILFIFPSIVYGSEIRRDLIDVTIHADGTASFTETWEVPEQHDTLFKKDFFNAKGVEISDFKIVNKSGLEYKYVKRLDKNERKTFSKTTHERSTSYNIVLDTYKDDVYTITYNVNGMIKKYSDGVYGIDFTFIGINYNMKINNILIKITSEVPLMETNTALYGLGKDLVLNLTEGVINLNTYTYDNKSTVRLFTKFTDLSFEHVINVNDTFQDAYDKAKNQNSYVSYILNIISIRTLLFIVLAIVIGITISVVISIINKKKKNKDFNGIDTYMNKTIPLFEEADYYKDVSIYNLYKGSFLASYFNISKNRSDLVGAFILKWIYDGIIDVFPKDSKPFIRLNQDTLVDDMQLDKDLFGMLKEASSHNIIDGSKLDRFSTNHYLRVMTWYNMGVSNVINTELMMDTVKRVNKGNKVHLELQEQIIAEAKNLQGLKKYLLNFNQVPRETELTENTYKYLLIYAELFGVGNQVAKEILRKNPDNIYAQKLLELEGVRFLYKNFYEKAYDKYKLLNKNNLSDISTIDTEIDSILRKNQ